MPDKTPGAPSPTKGERLVEEWCEGWEPFTPGPSARIELSSRIDTLLSEQSAGLVLDLTALKVAEMGRSGAPWIRRDDLERAIRIQLPSVKVLV